MAESETAQGGTTINCENKKFRTWTSIDTLVSKKVFQQMFGYGAH